MSGSTTYFRAALAKAGYGNLHLDQSIVSEDARIRFENAMDAAVAEVVHEVSGYYDLSALAARLRDAEAELTRLQASRAGDAEEVGDGTTKPAFSLGAIKKRVAMSSDTFYVRDATALIEMVETLRTRDAAGEDVTALRNAFMEGRHSMSGTDRHYAERAWDNFIRRRSRAAKEVE